LVLLSLGPGRYNKVDDGYGAWVRPISDRSTHEISEEERRFENGGRGQVLDVVSIAMIESRPARHQRENHLIDKNYYWELQRRATWPDIVGAVDHTAGPLWKNDHSTYHGINDKVPEHLLETLVPH